MLYFNSFLHQTTTLRKKAIRPDTLYFNSFLHQTTTVIPGYSCSNCCTSIRFYIKPQLIPYLCAYFFVVLQFVSTSNHNAEHQAAFRSRLYFNSFLHQTTTNTDSIWSYGGCTSIRFYIKPQPLSMRKRTTPVVLQFVSTSNHNSISYTIRLRKVVLQFVSTSNHNERNSISPLFSVVLQFVSTSNHNLSLVRY